MKLLRITELSQITESSPICVEHDGVPYSVVKTRGAVKAFVTICSHADKPFTARIDRDCLICPFHNVSFDAFSGKVQNRNGKNVPTGLTPVKTEIREGVIYLVVEDAHRELLDKSQARREERRAKKQRRNRWFGFFK